MTAPFPPGLGRNAAPVQVQNNITNCIFLHGLDIDSPKHESNFSVTTCVHVCVCVCVCLKERDRERERGRER